MTLKMIPSCCFITRVICSSISTENKWIDVVELDLRGKISNKNDFSYFIVELFEKKQRIKTEWEYKILEYKEIKNYEAKSLKS